ncbi:MAG: DCC1-like thiol-disulfide oxidoreductase family protein [Pyrinomonadaceae bacterium]
MPTIVSSEPDPVKFGPDPGGKQAEEQNAPFSSVPEDQPSTSSMPRSGLRKKIEELFAVDLRSLALTRIAAALLVLVDLIWRSTSLTAFYSDRGLVPRAAVYERIANSWELSLHLMSGRTEVQALLFVISGILALMLLAGYKTRSVSFWIWLLYTSLNSRNFYVIHGGDALLNMLLFWGMFVPWGAKYSVDSALNSSSSAQPRRVVSIGTAALLLQMPIVYFFGGILKNGAEWRHEFTAIYYVLSAPDFATWSGRWMASWPMPILKGITASTIVLEISGAVLLFSPLVTRTIRALVLPAFVLLQIGLGLTMKLGLFPLISTAAILPFIPGRLWDKLFFRMRTPSRTGLRIYYDGDCKFCRKAVLLIKEFCLWPDTFVGPAQASFDINADMQLHNSWVVIDHQNRRHYKFEALTYVFRQSPLFWFPGLLLSWPPLDRAGKFLYERVANNRGVAAWLTRPLKYRPVRVKQPLFLSLLCAFFLAYVLLDNLGSVKRTHLRVPEKLGGIGQMLRIHQRWRMFAPSPLRNFDWYLVEGKLLDGQELCVVNGVSVSCRQPGNYIPSLKNYRWRTYWRYVGSDSGQELRPHLARYICDSWNNSQPGGQALNELAIYKLRQPLRLDDSKEQSEKIQLWKDQCFAKDGTSGSKTEQVARKQIAGK